MPTAEPSIHYLKPADRSSHGLKPNGSKPSLTQATAALENDELPESHFEEAMAPLNQLHKLLQAGFDVCGRQFQYLCGARALTHETLGLFACLPTIDPRISRSPPSRQSHSPPT